MTRLKAVAALAAVASASSVFAASVFGCFSATCEDYGNCVASNGGSDGGDVVVPPGCEPSADPKDQPACVDDSFALFVDGTSGNDQNPGTKAAPVRTLMSALAKVGSKTRVYVCEGTYAEHVKLTSAVSLVGGFACGSWSYVGEKAKIAPSQAGYALLIERTPSRTIVSDLQLEAKGAAVPGESSIAVFASESSEIALVRCDLAAGDGLAAAPPAAFVSNHFAGDPTGNSAMAAAGAAEKACSCPSYGSSTGGAGGGGGVVGSPDGKGGGDGGAAPVLPVGAASVDGKGGSGGMNPIGACTVGNFGAAGAARASAPASTVGRIDTTGWHASSGSEGLAGNPGQGGGGGGGAPLAATGAGGGGGGCGGCGGAGGAAGGGGGSSIALVSFQTPIVARSVTVRTAAAGHGAAGGMGQAGGGGGGGGGTVGACSGGRGGNGAGGGGGSGGSGGVSLGIAYVGGAPKIDDEVVSSADQAAGFTLGLAGAKGTKGAGGAASAVGLGGSPGLEGGDGLDGFAKAVHGF